MSGQLTYSVVVVVFFSKADYAEERLDAREEFQEELDQALLIRKMVEMGLHDRALERLMAVTEVRHVFLAERECRSTCRKKIDRNSAPHWALCVNIREA